MDLLFYWLIAARSLLRRLKLEDGTGNDVIAAGRRLVPAVVDQPGVVLDLGALQGQASRPDQGKVYLSVETRALGEVWTGWNLDVVLCKLCLLSHSSYPHFLPTLSSCLYSQIVGGKTPLWKLMSVSCFVGDTNHFEPVTCELFYMKCTPNRARNTEHPVFIRLLCIHICIIRTKFHSWLFEAGLVFRSSIIF